MCAHRQYSMVGTVTYYDDDDDDDSMCRNLCNQTWSIRVCDDPGIECIRWNAMHAVAATVFIVGSIVFGLAALSPKVQLEPGRTGMGILKTMLCMSAVICLVGFAITLSYTVTESVSVYTRQIDVLFGLAMSVLLAWAGGLCALRVKGKRVAWRDGYAPLTVQ